MPTRVGNVGKLKVRLRTIVRKEMKTKKAQPDQFESPSVCEKRHDVFVASTADYVYGVTMHQGRWIATFHGAGCEAITGYTPAEMEADPLLWCRMIHDEDRVAVLQQLSRLSQSQDVPPIEHRIVSKTAKVRWIRNVQVLQRDGPGGIVSYSGVISDITERKQSRLDLEHTYNELTKKGDDLNAAARELRATDEKLKATELDLIQAAKLESIGRLAAGVAHEVKNPLQTILMGVDYLTQNLADAPVASKEVIQEMRRAVSRASIIIQGLLELAAKSVYETHPEDLNACVLRSLALLQYELQATQTETLLNLQRDIPAVPMDALKLEQALSNILLNAIQATRHGGTVKVATRVDSSVSFPGLLDLAPGAPARDVAVIEIQDSGPGIPEADLEKIFDPFFSTKSPGMGTGLGLSIVRKIVRLHGGAIKIENAAGGGALVRLILQL